MKILEEPPPYCVFLFCTTEPHKIPATIESRALHFAFRSPAPAAIRAHLAEVAKKEQVAVEPEALDLLARAADGSVRDGLSALDQVRALADGRDDRTITAAAVRDALGLIPGEVVTRFLAALPGGDAAAALAVVAELDREGQDLRSFAAELLDRVRHAAVARAVGRDADAAELAELSIEQLAWLGKVLDETEMRLRQNAPQRVLMDLAAVRMTRMASLPALAGIVEALGRSGGPAGGGNSAGGTGRPAVPAAAPPRIAPQPPAAPPPRPTRARTAPSEPPPETAPAETEPARGRRPRPAACSPRSASSWPRSARRSRTTSPRSATRGWTRGGRWSSSCAPRSGSGRTASRSPPRARRCSKRRAACWAASPPGSRSSSPATVRRRPAARPAAPERRARRARRCSTRRGATRW